MGYIKFLAKFHLLIKVSRKPLLLFFLLFAGCLSLPQRQEQEKTWNEISFTQTMTGAVESGSFTPGNWPSNKWWELFSDPQLTALMQMALDGNHSLKQAIANVGRAYQLAKAQKATLFPEVDLHGDYNWEYLGLNTFYRKFAPTVFPARFHWYELFVNLTYEFDFWGQNRNRYLAALDESKALAAEAVFSTLNICSIVAQTYFLIQTSLIRLSLFERNIAVREKIHQMRVQRFEDAIDPLDGELESDMALLGMRNQVVMEKKSLEVARHLLFALLGEGPEAPIPIEKVEPLFEQPFPLPEIVPLDLIARRPDLMAEIWKVEAKSHTVGVAKAAFYPNVNILAFLGLQSVDVLHLLFSRNSGEAQILPAFNLPIFTAGKLKANLSAAEADFQAAIESYHQQLLSAVQEIADQITIITHVEEELKNEAKKLKSSEGLLELASLRFQHALGTSLEVLQAEDAFLQEELLWVDLKQQKLLALVDLIKSLGGGYIQDGSRD